MEWLTTAQVAARTHRHVETVRAAVAIGDLHGHQAKRGGKSVRGSRWTIADGAADAWVQGLDVPAQERACGCAGLRAVPAGRPARRAS